MAIYYHLAISIVNTHHGIMRFLVAYANGCINSGPPHNGKPIWFWTLHSTKAADFLREISPYLIIKKSEAEIAIEFQAHMNSHVRCGRGHIIPPDTIAIRESFRLRIREARALYSRQYHELE